MKKEVVLVLGGAGYIGSHMCAYLDSCGLLPVTVDDFSTGNSWAVKWGPLERGDLQDFSFLSRVCKSYKPCAVMHLAARSLVGESMQEPLCYYEKNIGGMQSLLRAVVQHKIPYVVFSSTCAVYGDPEGGTINEALEKKPLSPYGKSKWAAEMMLQDAARAHHFSYASLRYFNASGADPEARIGEFREVETHLIPILLEVALGKREKVLLYGNDYPTPDGSAIRDYIHVQDLACAHLKALQYMKERKGNLELNLGTGRGYSVLEMIHAAEQVTGKTIPYEISSRREGDPPSLVADTFLAEKVLGFKAERSGLEDILKDAWRWTEKFHYLSSDVAAQALP